MVESVDESVGRVMATLKELGLEQEHASSSSLPTTAASTMPPATRPLRANKGAYYEGGIRVPLIIKWPGVTKPG